MSSYFGASLIVLCSALWATDALFRKPLTGSLESSTIVFLEHCICVLVTFPFFFFKRKEISSLNFKGWFFILFIGIFGSAAATLLFTSSYRHINPSIAILLQKTQPVFVLILARFLLKEKLRREFYHWAIVVVLASTMISLPSLWSPREVLEGFPTIKKWDWISPESKKGILYALGASLIWGICTVFGKWVSQKTSFVVISFLRFFWGFLALFVFWIYSNWDKNLPFSSLFFYFSQNNSALKSILYMALLPGVLAMFMYYAGLKRTKASIATFCEMVFPIASVILNWKFLNQPLDAIQIAGGTLLLIAIFFITRE